MIGMNEGKRRSIHSLDGTFLNRITLPFGPTSLQGLQHNYGPLCPSNRIRRRCAWRDGSGGTQLYLGQSMASSGTMHAVTMPFIPMPIAAKAAAIPLSGAIWEAATPLPATPAARPWERQSSTRNQRRII